MKTQRVDFKNSNNGNITMAAILFLPEGFNEANKYPAIGVTYPGGGVKEQAASNYATKFAEAGFVAIAYDASYQGESTGEPRSLENPYICVEDISAVVDYLSAVPYMEDTASAIVPFFLKNL